MSYEKFGKDIETVLRVVKTARKIGVTNQFWSLLASEQKMRMLAELIFPEHLVVSVDYDSDINIFHKKFELTNQSRKKLSFIRGERKREVKVKVPMKIIHKGYPGDDYLEESIITTDRARSEIEKAKCRSAIINELQALGKEYPCLQHEYDIVALGSVYSLFTPGEGEELYVPVLSSEKGEPIIKLEPLKRNDNQWKYSRFAAVLL